MLSTHMNMHAQVVAACILISKAIMDESLIVVFWQHILDENGFAGRDERKEVLAQFLARNHLTRLLHLQYAEHPSKWLGAEGVANEELEFIWGLKRVVRQRSR